MKTIQLYEGTEESKRYAITMEVYNTGGFKAKGRIRQWTGSKRSMKIEDLTETQVYKHRVRNKDRMWFNSHIGKGYMKGKEVHHEWENGAICYVIGKREHREGEHAQVFWS